MTARQATVPRVLAVDPICRGFGFAVLEGPASLVDWGIYEARQLDDDRVITKVAVLIGRYRPDLIILEDPDHRSCRRRARAKQQIAAIRELAKRLRIPCKRVAIAAVRDLFQDGGKADKNKLAVVVAEHLPVLTKEMPRPRKFYLPENRRMAVFDAVAFALTYYFRLPEGALQMKRPPHREAA